MATMSREKFEALARKYIKRDGLENILESMSTTDFYIAPASTRYHHSYEGGLVEHSIEVFEHLKNDCKDNLATEESIAIVSLFHDICKINFYKVETRNTKDERGKWIQVPYYTIEDKLPLGHGEKSVILLLQHMNLAAEETMAINAHMGGFDSRGENVISNTFNICPLALHLHIADLKSTYLK